MKQFRNESRGCMKYRDYNDNELISYIEEQNEDAEEILFEKYKPLIVRFAKKIYPIASNVGLELNDLIQEGMLGLNQAIKYYDEKKDAHFYTFAKTCIERKMITLLNNQRRLKHKILNESLSLDHTGEDKMYGIESVLKDSSNDPELVLLTKEREEKLIRETREALTDFEDEVFMLRINQFTYDEIASILEKDKKSIDNALQRIRTKMKGILEKLS